MLVIFQLAPPHPVLHHRLTVSPMLGQWCRFVDGVLYDCPVFWMNYLLQIQGSCHDAGDGSPKKLYPATKHSSDYPSRLDWPKKQ